MSKPFNPSRRTVIRSLASASMLLPGMLHEMLAEPKLPLRPLSIRSPRRRRCFRPRPSASSSST